MVKSKDEKENVIMIYEEKNYDGWLKNLIDKKIKFLCEDEFYDKESDVDIMIPFNVEWELSTKEIK